MRNIFSLFICILLSSSIFAQNFDMTPYEKGRKELADEALSKIFDSFSALDQLAFGTSFLNAIGKTDDIFEQTAIAENFIVSMCGVGDMFKTEANYLASSIWAPTAYTGQMLQNLKVIGEWYKTQRTALEKSKTEKDVKRESDRAMNNRGISAVNKKISKKFAFWAQKGEIEKTPDFQQRLKDRSIYAFDSLCFIGCSEIIRQNVKLIKKGYNADDEVYNVQWNITDDNGKVLSSQNGYFHLSPDHVQSINRADYISWEDTYAFGIGVYDGYIFPTKVRVEFSRERLYPIIIFPEIKEQLISSDIVDDIPSQHYLEGHSYNSQDYRNRIIFRDEANAKIEQIKDKLVQAYSNYHSHMGWSDLNTPPTWYFPCKESYCSIESFNEAFSQFKIRYAKQLFKSLVLDSNRHLTPNITSDKLIEIILEGDVSVLKGKIRELQLEWLTSESQMLKKEQLQRGLWNIHLFNILTNMETDYVEYCSKEEMCKAVIENNAYLSSRIKVKNSYYDALKLYYEKHKY